MNVHQEFEAGWWGDCTNTFGEETKQLSYARRMGLEIVADGGHWPVYDMQGHSVLDLGGGPASILLKTINLGTAVVVDPCPYPDWVDARYAAHGITYMREGAEDYAPLDVPLKSFDECWIYNVLQHVEDPYAVILTARSYAKVIRIYEWIDMAPHLGHPHELKADLLDTWIGTRGTVEQMNENGCVGRAYYAVAAL